jgi:hypothetical protein
MEVSGQLHAAGMRALGTHWIGGWVDPRASLDAVAEREKSLPCPRRELNPGRPARSQYQRIGTQNQRFLVPYHDFPVVSHHFAFINNAGGVPLMFHNGHYFEALSLPIGHHS